MLPACFNSNVQGKNRHSSCVYSAILGVVHIDLTSNSSASYAQFAGQGAGAASNDTITTKNNTNISTVSQVQFDAAQIYQTKNMTVLDPGIRNLAIIIPDNIIGSNGSAPSWPTFLPASATIAEGMRVLWFNADVNATHSVVIRNSDGATLNSTTGIPYLNATVYRLRQAGQYTFSDPSLPGKNGTINVVEPTSFNASSFTNLSGSVGLFVVPAAGKPVFDGAINRLGFNGVSTFNFTTFQSSVNNSANQSTDNILAGTQGVTGTSNAKILYVWTQETSGIHTTVTRIASKVRLLEDILYPDGMVKPS